jgi:nucleosome binding factor SPN SPT16 subunit
LASEAAKAIEELNGKWCPIHAYRYKVMISHSIGDRKQLRKKESYDHYYQKMLQITIQVTSSYSEARIYSEFVRYGEIQNVEIVCDQIRKLGQITYFKASDAASALENCHRKFKPRFQIQEEYEFSINFKNLINSLLMLVD